MHRQHFMLIPLLSAQIFYLWKVIWVKKLEESFLVRALWSLTRQCLKKLCSFFQWGQDNLTPLTCIYSLHRKTLMLGALNTAEHRTAALFADRVTVLCASNLCFTKRLIKPNCSEILGGGGGKPQAPSSCCTRTVPWGSLQGRCSLLGARTPNGPWGHPSWLRAHGGRAVLAVRRSGETPLGTPSPLPSSLLG